MGPLNISYHVQRDLPQLGAGTQRKEGGTRFLDGQAGKKAGTESGRLSVTTGLPSNNKYDKLSE